MAIPGAATASPILDTSSLIPLVERAGAQLQAREERKKARQDQINKSWTDMLSSMSYEGLDPIQNKAISSKDSEMMNRYISDVKKYNGQIPEDVRMTYLREQNQNRAARDRMKAANQNVLMLNEQIKGKDYYLHDKIKQDSYNNLHTYDEKTGTWTARDDVNPDEFLSMLNNPDYIDGPKFFQSLLENVEAVTATSTEKGPLGTFQNIQTQFKPFWKTNESGVMRDANGNPILDWAATAELIAKDPNTRKIFQGLAAKEGKTLAQYIDGLMQIYNKPSEMFKSTIKPPASYYGGGGSRKDYVQEEIVLNKVGGLFKQSDEIMDAAVESNIPTGKGYMYEDVTHLIDYNLGRKDGKLYSPYKILLDPMDVGNVYVVDKEGDEPKRIPSSEYANLISKIETFNKLPGLKKVGVERGYFTTTGKSDLTRIEGATPQVISGRQEGVRKIQAATNQLKNNFSRRVNEIKENIKNKGFTLFGKKFSDAEAQSFESEINKNFSGAKIHFSKQEAKDLMLPNQTMSNLEFTVESGDEPIINIKADGVDVTSVTLDELNNYLKTGKIILGRDVLENMEITPESEQTTEPSVEGGETETIVPTEGFLN